jgi:hypothetical protein
VESGRSGLVYAALGDSMSIDHYAGGPGRGAASLLWRNRDDDFPAWAGKDLTTRNPTAQLTQLASDGSDLRHRCRRAASAAAPAGAHPDAGDRDDGRQRPAGRLWELHRRPTGHPEGGRQRPAAPGQSAGLAGPVAPIVVATVYDPSDGTGDARRLGLPFWPAALDLLAELNQTLRRLANEHRALVADVHGRFLGHGLAAGDPAQLDPRPSNHDLWYCGLIEPNAWGASEIRAAFWEAVATNRSTFGS